MSGDIVQPEEGPDFTTVTVDGAFIRFSEGLICLQFYRDTAFPRIEKNGVPLFENKRREILHETRMSIKNASQLADNISTGLQIYGQYVDRKSDYIQTLKMAASSSGVNFERILATLHAYEITSKISSILMKTTHDGQKRILELLEKTIDDEQGKIDAIIKEYPLVEEKKENA